MKFILLQFFLAGFYLENFFFFKIYVWEGPTRSAKILQRMHGENIAISYENALLSFGSSL